MPTRGELGRTLMLSISHIPQGRTNRSGSPLQPKYITVHNTDNSSIGADAEAHANFLSKTGYYIHNGSKRWVSWHFTVDDDSCVRHLPLNEVGWHAGSSQGNAYSLGIEICMNKGIDQNRAFDRAKTLIACLCYDLNLEPETQVVTHRFWSGKNCPRLLLDNGKEGAACQGFIADVRAILNSIDDPAQI